MASIVDVAKLAGVSPATVSRVLSGASYSVSQETRSRVLAAADTLDFVPNALARGLLKSKVPVVGVIVHDITDPYFAEIVRGVEDAATPAGYLVIAASSDRDAAREASYVRLLRSVRAAMVIFASSGMDEPDLSRVLARHALAIRGYGGAVVHLSPHAHGPAEVGPDNVAAMAALVGALARTGHRSIAFLAGPERLFVARERREGYRAGLAAAGLPFDPRLTVHCAFNSDGGAQGVDRLVDGGFDCTAIVCANDLLALGAVTRLGERGIVVPDDISVAGFDDISLAAHVAPSLTTVRLPLHEMGRLGFEYGQRTIEGGRPRRQVLATEVVVRASTAPPASARMRTRSSRGLAVATAGGTAS